MESIALIKLGGSVITDKARPYTARKGIIRSLAKACKEYKRPFIIAHGAGSFAHTSAKIYGGMHGYASKSGLAKVAFDASALNTIVTEIFIEEELPAVSFHPLSMISAKKGVATKQNFEPLEALLTQGFLPIVFGDVIADMSWNTTIFSGEKILRLLSLYLQKRGYKVNRIIEVSNTNGVYDQHTKTIPHISLQNWKSVQKAITHSDAPDVTGGMLHKVEEALFLAKKGIRTDIINGLQTQELSNALRGKTIQGTMIY